MFSVSLSGAQGKSAKGQSVGCNVGTSGNVVVYETHAHIKNPLELRLLSVEHRIVDRGSVVEYWKN